MPSRFEEVRDDVLSHPLHRACGLRLHKAADGESEVEIELNDFTLNPEGSLHGGMLYTFFDVACFFACLTLLEADKHPNAASSYRVTAIPALFVFKGGEVVERHTGATNKQRLVELVANHV